MNALEDGCMKFVDVGTGQIDLSPYALGAKIFERLTTTALIHKADGAIDDEASLCFVCHSLEGPGAWAYIHEMSLATLRAALAQAGYDIVKR